MLKSSAVQPGIGDPFPALPDAFLSELRAERARLTRSERKIADFLLAESAESIRLSITEFAARVHVGEATITRFCRRLGLRGFQDLKLVVAQEIARGTEGAIEISADRHASNVPRDVTRRSIHLIADTARLLSPDTLVQAASLLARARRIDCYGAGLSGLTALEAQLGFMRIGKRCNAHSDPDAQLMSAALLTPRDVAIGFSHSGNAAAVATALQRARDLGATTIAITSQRPSPVAIAADLVVPVAPGETPYASSINSKIAHLFVLDLLLESVAEVRDTEIADDERAS